MGEIIVQNDKPYYAESELNSAQVNEIVDQFNKAKAELSSMDARKIELQAIMDKAIANLTYIKSDFPDLITEPAQLVLDENVAE